MEKMIFVNQKMYLNSLKEVDLFQKDLASYKNDIVVFPSTLYLQNYIDKGYTVGSQNISDEIKGPHTAEVSASALKDLKVEYVLIGHHEVREKYKEENVQIISKIEKALENNLKVVLCVGETIEEKKNNQTYEVIKKQLNHIKPNENIIISYEPVWSIGTNKIPENFEIYNIVKYIKTLGHHKVLYGGSVSDLNIEKLNKIDNLDGFLIGGCAQKTEAVKKIIEVVLK